MRLLDLFAGIGGFSLAAHWMGWQTTAFVEWNPFCQEVLAKNFPDVPIYADIRDFDGTKYRDRIDIITGGFPCQPFSQAGKQKGKGDDRYLFPEMLRVIEEVRPKWIVAENVRGLLSIQNGKVFSEICSQLESQDYNVWTFGVPASAVEAPHERMRLWIIAHSEMQDRRGKQGSVCREDGRPRTALLSRSSDTDRDASDSDKKGERGLSSGEGEEYSSVGFCNSESSNTRYANGRQLARSSSGGFSRGQTTDTERSNQWSENWLEAATRFCRMDDGVSAELDVPRDNRVNRLKALGNSIVPQIAYEIFRSLPEE